MKRIQKPKKQPKKPVATRQSKMRAPALKTAEEFFKQPEKTRDTLNRVAHVVSKMRATGMSLRHAAEDLDIDPRTVVRRAKTALRKNKQGHYVAKAHDQLVRVLVLPTSNGLKELATRDSRQATELGKYSDAVQKYLQTGDDSTLRKFKRKRITDASGKRVPLLVDLGELDRLAGAGVLSFESLYARAA